VAGSLLLLAALGLATVAVLDPSWLVVDIREFQAEHHVGGAKSISFLKDILIEK
jgi:hypothetical protein